MKYNFIFRAPESFKIKSMQRNEIAELPHANMKFVILASQRLHTIFYIFRTKKPILQIYLFPYTQM